MMAHFTRLKSCEISTGNGVEKVVFFRPLYLAICIINFPDAVELGGAYDGG